MNKTVKILITALLCIVGVVVIAVIAFILFMKWASKQPAVKSDYYENTVTNMPLEQKYTNIGDFEVSSTVYKSENKEIGQFKVWYPTEMESKDKKYPLVVMANGTGVKASKYEAIFEHLASWGFIVIGNEDENSRTGTSSAVSLNFMLGLNEDSNSFFYGKIDTDNIGIGGHSQGGVGAINAVTAQENGSLYKTVYTASATSPYWGQDSVFGAEWRYDTSKINIPCLMVGGTGNADAGTAEDISATEGQGICPLWGMKIVYDEIPDSVCKVMARRSNADHGDMLSLADGYMTAWFMYWLKGDDEAGEVFFGDNAEILNNSNWQDTRKNR
ncbi:MAG: alpha/beta hydrolase [Oscillospiraceae bacterium]